MSRSQLSDALPPWQEPLSPADTRRRTLGGVALLCVIAAGGYVASAASVSSAQPARVADATGATPSPTTPVSPAPSTTQPAIAPAVAELAEAPPATQSGGTAAPAATPTTPAAHLPACSADALAVGIWHHPYAEAAAADLVSIGGRHQLHREAAAALRTLIAAAQRDGVALTVGSAFRSVVYQGGIIQRKKARGMSAHEIYRYSSPAGYSEHHTGFVVDFSPIDNSFARTPASHWLQQHAAQYGWQQSFTAQSTAADGMYRGIASESWHWRYVGSATARAALAVAPCVR